MLRDKDVEVIANYLTNMRVEQEKTNELLAIIIRELQALREWIQKENLGRIGD